MQEGRHHRLRPLAFERECCESRPGQMALRRRQEIQSSVGAVEIRPQQDQDLLEALVWLEVQVPGHSMQAGLTWRWRPIRSRDAGEDEIRGRISPSSPRAAAARSASLDSALSGLTGLPGGPARQNSIHHQSWQPVGDPEMAPLPVLETERLVLREVSLADGPALQAYEYRQEQWRLQAMEPEEFADGTLRVQRYLEHRGPDHERRMFAYVGLDKTTDALVGQVSLSRSHPAIASLGIGVSHCRWRQGYGLEMARRIIRFGFEDVGLNRIAADVAVENERCIKLLECAGMVREGVARECIWAQGRWWTEAQYAMLRSDLDRR
jgi:ribosomal-protein-alanine N-acetyltransferase